MSNNILFLISLSQLDESIEEPEDLHGSPIVTKKKICESRGKKEERELILLEDLANTIKEPIRIAYSNPSEEEDEDVAFGKSIVSEMRQIKDLQVKLQLKKNYFQRSFRGKNVDRICTADQYLPSKR